MEEYNSFVKAISNEMTTPIEYPEKFFEYTKNQLPNEFKNLPKEKYLQWTQERVYLMRNILNKLINSKIFIVKNPEVLNLLSLTDNEIYKRKLPYDNLFINTTFKLKDGLLIKGVFIFKEPKGTILVCARTELTDKKIPHIMIFDLFSKTLEETDFNNPSFKSSMISKPKEEYLQLFICNFLDFLNNPEIEIKEIEENQEQNKKRIKRGKPPISTRFFINVEGKLKIYINKIKSENHLQYSYKFWVRGHYTHFWKKFHYFNLYKLGAERLEKEGYQWNSNLNCIIKWKYPYTKGEGILIDKHYKLKQQGGDNERLVK